MVGRPKAAPPAETARFGAAHRAAAREGSLPVCTQLTKSCRHFLKLCLHEISKNTQNSGKKILTFEIRCYIIVKPLIMGFEIEVSVYRSAL